MQKIGVTMISLACTTGLLSPGTSSAVLATGALAMTAATAPSRRCCRHASRAVALTPCLSTSAACAVQLDQHVQSRLLLVL